MTRVCALGLITTLAAPLGAQQMMTVQSQAEENALKSNVMVFEQALRLAIIQAGQKLGQWAGQVAPGVIMVFAEQPSVRSVPLSDNSLVFHVEVSEILPTANSLFLQSLQMQGVAVPPGASRVGAMSPAETAAPGKSPDSIPRVTMTPDLYYTTLVHDALVDSMLDSSGALPMRAGQKLIVACTPVEVSQRGLRNPSRQLVLEIKGEDLLAWREKTITRDEAKRRIVERRF